MPQSILMKKLFLLLFISSFAAGIAQNGNIRGFVYDKESGEPMSFVTVFLAGTNYGVQTNVDGFFSITQLPSGNFKLKIQKHLNDNEIEIFGKS